MKLKCRANINMLNSPAVIQIYARRSGDPANIRTPAMSDVISPASLPVAHTVATGTTGVTSDSSNLPAE